MAKSGYTLEQLLSWCVEDRLIEDFTLSDGSIEISRQGDVREFGRPEAINYLKDLFGKESQAVGRADPYMT